MNDILAYSHKNKQQTIDSERWFAGWHTNFHVRIANGIRNIRDNLETFALVNDVCRQATEHLRKPDSLGPSTLNSMIQSSAAASSGGKVGFGVSRGTLAKEYLRQLGDLVTTVWVNSSSPFKIRS